MSTAHHQPTLLVTCNGFYLQLTHRMTQHGEWYRLFTPMLLHADLAHIIMNSLSLYNIGTFVESQFGALRYVLVYTLSGVAGNALSAVVNPRAPSVGASGAVCGLVGECKNPETSA